MTTVPSMPGAKSQGLASFWVEDLGVEEPSGDGVAGGVHHHGRPDRSGAEADLAVDDGDDDRAD